MALKIVNHHRHAKWTCIYDYINARLAMMMMFFIH